MKSKRSPNAICVWQRKGCNQILPLRHNPCPSGKQDTICCHWAGHWLDGGVKGAGCPWAANRAGWYHRSSHDRPARAQGLLCNFYWRRLYSGPESDKGSSSFINPTPTFDFDANVGGRSHLKGVDAHVHASVISAGFRQPAKPNDSSRWTDARPLYPTQTHTRKLPKGMLWHLPVLRVLVRAAGVLDLLPVLHPEALLVDTVGAAQVALQREGWTVALHRKRGVFGGDD